MKTFADFKRDAAKGNMSLELLEWYGKTGEEIPKRIRGIRRVIKCTQSSLTLQGTVESRLDYLRSSLLDYDGETLTIYTSGRRPLNEQEQRIVWKWQQLEAEYKLSGKSDEAVYRLRKEYYRNSECPWLYSDSFVKGKLTEHDGNVPMIRDKDLRGGVTMRYKVHFEKGETTEVQDGENQ